MIIDEHILNGYSEFIFFNSGYSFIPNTCGNYFIYFPISGYFYIGSTGNLNKRFKQHKLDLIEKRHRNKKLQNVFNNAVNPIYFYYKETSSKEEYLQIEQALIFKFYHSELCCNKNISVFDTRGIKLSDENKINIGKASKLTWKRPGYKEKMGQLSKQNWQNPEYRNKLIDILKQNGQKPEFKEKMSAISKKMWGREGHREKASLAIKESHSNPEVIAKISQSSKERWNNPEYRTLMIEVAKKNFSNEEHSKSTSIRNKALWNDPVHRANRIKAVRAGQSTSEYKELRSKLSKSFWSDPEKRTKRIEALKRMGSNPEFKAKMKVINSARFNDPAYREKIRLIHLSRRKKVTVNGIDYECIGDAAKALNVNPKTLEYRIKTNTVHRCFK